MTAKHSQWSTVVDGVEKKALRSSTSGNVNSKSSWKSCLSAAVSITRVYALDWWKKQEHDCDEDCDDHRMRLS